MLGIDTVSVVILITACVGIWWMLRGIPKTGGNPLSSDRDDMAQDREDLPYKVFTREFDIECDGDELDALLIASRNDLEPTWQSSLPSPDQLEANFAYSHGKATAELGDIEMPQLDGYSVLILLDQSGSMARRMAHVSGSVRAALEWLEQAGASTMLAGFTTVGWKGGRSRDKWSKFYRTLLADDFAPLVTSAKLFENVDGEALLWAREQLAAASGDKRILVILSDGAPVDDSTLAENGNWILWRHLEQVVAELESDDTLRLGAVGIDHRVEELYSHSRFVDQAMIEQHGALGPAIIEVIAELDQL